MNLVEKLLQTDVGKFEELQTKEIVSKRLGKAMGEENTKITIKEIPARRMNDLLALQFNSKGRFDMSRSFDAKAMVAAEGVICPDLKDERLQKHFGCKTSKDLAVKLFGNEITGIADELVSLAGLGDVESTDEEIKN